MNSIDFITTFKESRSREIAAVLLAWLSVHNETPPFKRVLDIVMCEDCYSYVTRGDFSNLKSGSLFRILSYEHLRSLLEKLHIVYTNGNLLSAYKEIVLHKKRKIKYAHEALAELLSGGTMFEPRESKSTFYRYNWLIYVLREKLCMWEEMSSPQILIPCSDSILKASYKLGFTRKQHSATLKSAVLLTEIAENLFGNHPYKLYEKCLGLEEALLLTGI